MEDANGVSGKTLQDFLGQYAGAFTE